jgi:hypothetical protein
VEAEFLCDTGLGERLGKLDDDLLFLARVEFEVVVAGRVGEARQVEGEAVLEDRRREREKRLGRRKQL